MTARTRPAPQRQTLDQFRLASYAADERARAELELQTLRDRVALECIKARNLHSRYIRTVAP